MPAYLLYGSLLGVAQTLATIVVFALGLHAAGANLQRAQFVESLIGFILMIVIVALGLRAARAQREARGETSTFGAGALSALALAFIAAQVAALGQWLYFRFLNPGFSLVLREAISPGTAELIAKLPVEQAEQARRNVDLAQAVTQGTHTFLFSTVVGLAFAVVLRAAQRRAAADQAAPKA